MNPDSHPDRAALSPVTAVAVRSRRYPLFGTQHRFQQRRRDFFLADFDRAPGGAYDSIRHHTGNTLTGGQDQVDTVPIGKMRSLA